ncbi:ArsA family ATPase [Synechococcus sp. PCC 6312]|uniref:Get3/ArsA fold putative tail anchor-mediating ATPase NosAFP n=1 Tax=Synechococcus sp. (strain ATCC 27167 / PCC 6312) TaxID=195253 RepID=UPI00029EEAB3|nr:ArsA family ATPase [Synechococcus sp. PCC 6312]AFY62461.1 oxyanion-translocating ATPase [Synechococcus sp. PCC 6312]
MPKVVAFLGSDIEPTAYAVAQSHAQAGQKTLILVPTPGIRFKHLCGTEFNPQPTTIAPNLEIVELQAIQILSGAWEELRKFVRDYVPADVLGSEVYAGELMVLPGMDLFLTLNAIRQYYQNSAYDVLVYAGIDPTTTLRFIGLPHALAWYYRRFGRILEDLDPVKIANAIGGPLATALLAANFDTQKISTALSQGKEWVEQGVNAVGDPQQLQVYLVTSPESMAIQQTQWLWGASQQVQVPISQVLVPTVNPAAIEAVTAAFSPLTVQGLRGNDRGLVDVASLPNLDTPLKAPPCQEMNVAQRQIKVFLPGLAKHQVKLTQFNGEITIEAADQRRHLPLPPELQNQPVTAGKFEAPYLIISF